MTKYALAIAIARKVAIVVTAVSGSLWVAVQTGILHYGPRASTVLASIAIGSAAAMPSILRPPAAAPPTP